MKELMQGEGGVERFGSRTVGGICGAKVQNAANGELHGRGNSGQPGSRRLSTAGSAMWHRGLTVLVGE